MESVPMLAKVKGEGQGKVKGGGKIRPQLWRASLHGFPTHLIW